jgi:putative nucleotidyltransferase with HDIG domain
MMPGAHVGPLTRITAPPSSACEIVARLPRITRRATTEEHSERVAWYSLLLGERVGLTRRDGEMLRVGALLHDIGKRAIPDAILLKPAPFTDAEFAVMKQHPIIGEAMCISMPAVVRSMIRSHHERIDGSGYPDGLRGKSVPLLAQIIALVDSFDAMTSTRPYRRPRSQGEAFAILRDDAKRGLFEMDLVEALTSLAGVLDTGEAAVA